MLFTMGLVHMEITRRGGGGMCEGLVVCINDRGAFLLLLIYWLNCSLGVV